jgi:hypothetical protein
MPFSCCRQSFGRAFALPPRTAGGAGGRSLTRPATRGIMSPLLYVITILAMMPGPLLAQENSVEIPTQSPRPQPQVQPSQPPDFGNPRFVFHRSDGALLRLDLVTGAVAWCSQNAADWTCVPGRDERAALDHEIARLQRDNAALKNALLERGVPLPNDMKAEAPTLPSASGGGGSRGAPVPAETIPRPPQTVPPAASAPPASAKSAEPDRASRDDAEIERIMTIMEKVWRRLVEMMMNIQRDLQKKG